MEPQSAAAAVITDIQLTGSIVKHCMAYMRNAHGAYNDILAILNVASDLQETLDNVHEVLQSDDRKILSTSSQLASNIAGCHSDLEALKAKLDPATAQRAIQLLGSGSLEWPLEPREVVNITQNLDKYRSSFLSFSEAIITDSVVEGDTIEKKSAGNGKLLTEVQGTQGRDAYNYSYQSSRNRIAPFWPKEDPVQNVKAPGITATKIHMRNALIAASERGNKETVQQLLDAGADVNDQGGQYGTALQEASWIGNKETVQLLLDAGADVNAQSLHGTALQIASLKGDKEMVQQLLDAGADVNSQGKHGTSLQIASWKGDKETVQQLLDAGADVNAQGGLYGNALQAASERGHKKIMQQLLNAGADVNAQGAETIRLDASDSLVPSEKSMSLGNQTTKQPSLDPNTDQSDKKTSESVPDAMFGIPRRTGWVPSRYPDQKNSGFRRSPSNEPIILRSRDNSREPKLGPGLKNMDGGAFLDPVSPLSPLPNQGDGSRKVGDLAELEAPKSRNLSICGKGRGYSDSSVPSGDTATTMGVHLEGFDETSDEQKEDKKGKGKGKEKEKEEICNEQLSASSPTSIVTVQRIIPKTQYDPSTEYRSCEPAPQPWPLFDDRSFMQDKSGAWGQDPRTVASSGQSRPLVGNPPSMQENPETWEQNAQTIVLPVGVWPPVGEKPFMQEISGAWVRDARTKVSLGRPDTFVDNKLSTKKSPEGLEQDTQPMVCPTEMEPLAELSEPGVWIQDEPTTASPDNMSNLEMKPKQVPGPRLQTPPLARPAVIDSEALQRRPVDTNEETEETSVPEDASPDLRPESPGWLGFLDEIVEDSSQAHENHSAPDPKITQDDEVNDAVKIKSMEAYSDDCTQIPGSSNRLIEDTSTKSRETEKRTILSSWWLRFMNFCDPPPSGFQRISYECGCGELSYLDVKELSAGGIERFRQRLLEDIAIVKASPQDSPDSNNPQHPPQALVNIDSSPGLRRQNVAVNPESLHRQSSQSTRVEDAQTSSTVSLNQDFQYAHLCINEKDSTILAYFEASSLNNDDIFFRQIKEMYQTRRDESGFKLSRVIPFFHKLSKWSPRFASLLNFFHLPPMHFFKIASGDFVRFSLVPIGMDYRPTWFKKELPPEDEVKASRYRYKPVPMDDVEISAIPLNHLIKAGGHSSSFWMNRFPKKLREPVAWPREQSAPGVIGWGMRINETLDWAVIIPFTLVILLAIGVSVIIYAAVTSDNSAAFGLGAYLVAIFTLYITYQYQAWKDSIVF